MLQVLYEAVGSSWRWIKAVCMFMGKSGRNTAMLQAEAPQSHPRV